MASIKIRILQVHDRISKEESLTNCRFYFDSCLRSLLKGSEELLNEYGDGQSVSWEVRQELLAGEPLIDWEGTNVQDRSKIKMIVETAKNMSGAAYSGEGEADLSHTAWEEIRELARDYLRSE